MEIGLFIGIVVATIFFQFFAPRYKMANSGDMVMKQDKWTGDSWKLEGNKWVQIMDSKRDWQPIDNALAQALNLPEAKTQSENGDDPMTLLKEKYPILKDISNEDIKERIKYVYARRIMVDMYFTKANLK